MKAETGSPVGSGHHDRRGLAPSQPTGSNLGMVSEDNTGRGNAAWATKALGVPRRTVQDMAAKGEIPGAALIRRRWTFDKAKLRRFIKDKEAEVARRAHVRPSPRPHQVGRTQSGHALRRAIGSAGPSLTELIRRSRERANEVAERNTKRPSDDAKLIAGAALIHKLEKRWAEDVRRSPMNRLERLLLQKLRSLAVYGGGDVTAHPTIFKKLAVRGYIQGGLTSERCHVTKAGRAVDLDAN